MQSGISRKCGIETCHMKRFFLPQKRLQNGYHIMFVTQKLIILLHDMTFIIMLSLSASQCTKVHAVALQKSPIIGTQKTKFAMAHFERGHMSGLHFQLTLAVSRVSRGPLRVSPAGNGGGCIAIFKLEPRIAGISTKIAR